jgi:hypothetical protein
MNNVYFSFLDQAPNRECSGQTPASCSNAMHGDSRFRCSLGQKRIAQRNQYRSMPAHKQTLQKQECLVLSSTVIPAKVDNQRTHAQASPGFGHGRCVSFSPARSRPSLRYLM